MLIELPRLDEEKERVLNQEIKPHFKKSRMGYIKVATGWGKTFLSKHIMREYYDLGKLVLFVVHGNNKLLKQTCYVNKDNNEKLFPNSLILSSDYPNAKDELRNYVQNGIGGFIVFASLRTINKDNWIRDYLCRTADLVIIDEIHNFIENQGNQFIDAIGERAKILGMTATPFQGVVGNVKYVADISGDMHEIYSKTLPICIMDGQLSELSYTIIRNNQSILDVFDFEKGLDELNSRDLFINCGTREKIDSVVRRTYLAKRIYDNKISNKSLKTLIFCSPVRNMMNSFEDNQKINVFHAKLCSAIFNMELKDKLASNTHFSNYVGSTKKFKNAVYLSSDIEKEDQDNLIREFKETDRAPFVLCSVGMLVEGFDFPELENLILLRPTLSMRLFEQQIGRITRKSPNKKCGNIFEVVDDTEPLYDTFGECVFNENILERLRMLDPENRIEALLIDGNNTDAIKKGKIRVVDICLDKSINIEDININEPLYRLEEKSVQIPPISLRAKYFNKLLSVIEKKMEGELWKEKERILNMAIGFKLFQETDASEISNLVYRLEILEHEAEIDTNLSNKCKKNKPKVFCEAKWMLKLKALTDLKYINLSTYDRNKILEILGFEPVYEKIDEFRTKCLKEGIDRTIGNLFHAVKNGIKVIKNPQQRNKFKRYSSIVSNIKSDIYWARCFIGDPEHPEFRELFESNKEWGRELREYFIKGSAEQER